MNKRTIPLTDLPREKEGKIVNLRGGHGFRKKIGVMGLREGQHVKVLSKQPFRGPLTVKAGKNHVTLGRGMARKIIVEVI
ncbi:MAG: FeoA family protein [Candidatus Thermoplasmatota archaeon]